MKAKSEHGTRLNEFVHEENHNRNRQTRAAMNIIPLEASLLSFFSFQSQAISPPNLRKSHWTFFLLVYFSSVMNFFVCPPLYFCVPFNLELSPLSFSGDISCFNNLGIVLAGDQKAPLHGGTVLIPGDTTAFFPVRVVEQEQCTRNHEMIWRCWWE